MPPHIVLPDIAHGGLYRFNILGSPRESSISCGLLKWRNVFQFQFPKVHSTERLEIENSASGWYRNISKYGRHDVTRCDKICFIEAVKRGELQWEIGFVLLREIYFLKADIDFWYLYSSTVAVKSFVKWKIASTEIVSCQLQMFFLIVLIRIR